MSYFYVATTNYVLSGGLFTIGDEETEPAVGTTPSIGADAVAIRHPKELRGGIAELQKRGLKITYFEDSSQR